MKRRGSRIARRGVSLLEVLGAAVVVSLMALPAVSMLATAAHESMVSEDYMFAEALAQRHLAELLARPPKELDERLPFEIPIGGVPPDDRVIGELYPEYGRNLTGDAAFRGTVRVSSLAEGLTCFEVALSWPVRPGSPVRRHYALFRLRSHHTLAVTSSHPFTSDRTGRGGR